jgi:hypothetical protein
MKSYPPGAMTEQNARELREQRQAIEDEQQAKSERIRLAEQAKAVRRGEEAQVAAEARERTERAHADEEDRLQQELGWALAELRKCAFDVDCSSPKAVRRSIEKQVQLTAALYIAGVAERLLHGHQSSPPS